MYCMRITTVSLKQHAATYMYRREDVANREGDVTGKDGVRRLVCNETHGDWESQGLVTPWHGMHCIGKPQAPSLAAKPPRFLPAGTIVQPDRPMTPNHQSVATRKPPQSDRVCILYVPVLPSISIMVALISHSTRRGSKLHATSFALLQSRPRHLSANPLGGLRM